MTNHTAWTIERTVINSYRYITKANTKKLCIFLTGAASEMTYIVSGGALNSTQTQNSWQGVRTPLTPLVWLRHCRNWPCEMQIGRSAGQLPDTATWSFTGQHTVTNDDDTRMHARPNHWTGAATLMGLRIHCVPEHITRSFSEYAGWRRRSFVSYLCELVFVAILYSQKCLLSLKYAFSLMIVWTFS